MADVAFFLVFANLITYYLDMQQLNLFMTPNSNNDPPPVNSSNNNKHSPLFFLFAWNAIVVGFCIIVLNNVGQPKLFWYRFIICIFFFLLGFTIGFLIGLPVNKSLQNLTKINSFFVNLVLGFTIANINNLKDIYFKLIAPVSYLFCVSSTVKCTDSLGQDKSIIVMTTMSFFLTAFVTGTFFSITQVYSMIQHTSDVSEDGSSARATTDARSDGNQNGDGYTT